jgi:hypothetical protein
VNLNDSETRHTSEPTVALTIVPTTHATSPIPQWLPWAGAAATAGLLAGAVATTLSVHSRREELENSCAQPRGPGCPDAEVDALESRHNLGTLLWAATGVAAAATGIGFYLDLAPRRAEMALRVRF